MGASRVSRCHVERRVPSTITRILTATLACAALFAEAGQAIAQVGEAAAAPHPVAANAASTIPTATDFAQIPFIEQAVLSPDGTYLAGMLGVKGERRICTMSLFEKGKLVCLIIPDGTEPYKLRWVNDQNVIVSLKALESVGSPFVTGPDRMYVTRLIGINRDTGKMTKLLWDLKGQNASDVLWMASDGSPVIEVAGQNSLMADSDFWPAVYRLNVETGHYDKIERGREGVIDWTADSRGVVRAGISYNDENRTAQLLYRGEHGGELRAIERADLRKDEDLIDPIAFVAGTDHALALHRGADGRNAIFEVDLTTRQDVRSVYAADRDHDVDAVRVDEADNSVMAALDSGADGKAHWLDPTLAAVQASFDAAVGDKHAEIMSLSRDHKRMLVRIDRPDTPGALYFYDVDDGAMHRIAWFNEELAARPLAPVSLVHYKARDGLEIEAVMTLPPGRPAKGLPIVMLPHGGPWAHDDLSFDYWAQFIASLGYAVIQPNFRGSTGYGAAFEHKGDGQMGAAMQDDVSDGLAWAVAQGIADPRRACIVGGSYGGYAAMWGIEKDPDLYRCAVSIAGVSALRREVNDFGDDIMGNKYKDDWKRMTPDFAAVSPINGIARIKVPLLLIHGEKDVTVDFGQSKSMYRRMLAAGKTVQLVDLPLADHHFGRQPDRETLLKTIRDFLVKYNPPDAAHFAANAATPAARVQ